VAARRPTRCTRARGMEKSIYFPLPPPAERRTRIVSCDTMSSVPLSSAADAVACLAFRMNEMSGDAAARRSKELMECNSNRPPRSRSITIASERNKDAAVKSGEGQGGRGHISRDQSRYYAAKDEQPSRAGLPHKGAPLDHPLFIS
jgi:hypothetical protein